jgi:tol-pal system protein YbgF
MLPAVVLAAALLFVPGSALAQQGSGNFLDNLFNRGQQQPAQQPPPPMQQAPVQQPGEMAQGGGNAGDASVRIDRIENALRQLTGSVEELQHQNQMLQMQLKRMQDDTEYRFQQMGARSGGNAAPMPAPMAPQAAPNAMPPTTGAAGQRSDAFNPALHPNAPGAPRTLGNPQAIAAPEPGAAAANEQPVGAPGGRPAGAPLDLSTLAGTAPAPQAPPPPATVANAAPMAAGPQRAPVAAPQSGALPPPPPRNPNATGTQLATLPPSSSPKDEYQLAYGYVLHKDYGLAEQAFRDFLRKYPHEKLLPDAQYWLGESQFQQQRYRDAAESFLAVSTKYEHSGKAPEALLRLGQSLAALHQKEAACATLGEVGRKYPHAAARVKRGVAREQKRTHC